MKALISTGDRNFTLKYNIPVPVPGPGEILVQVFAIAQNPTDWKRLSRRETEGQVIGWDFAGVVAQLPPNSGHECPRIAGERVCGLAEGAFAEYLVIPAELVISLPDDVSFEHGAQFSVACITACQCLYQELGLPTPLDTPSPAARKEPETILIWSGTSATGHYAIQLAKLAGLQVISTASPKNTQLVESLGADMVFDYADSWTAQNIFNATDGRIVKAIDCISDGMTPNQVSMSMSNTGGKIVTVLPYESRKPGVQTSCVLAQSILGKSTTVPFVTTGNPVHIENGKFYFKIISALLVQGKLKPMKMRLYTRGLASVKEGMEYMRLGKTHAEKLTYRIIDTPNSLFDQYLEGM
ncbi:chaperonin 10-like protein [Mycena floridula]|nr:chaperonin 10-like protein [Mycena floridula]